jgi:branched-chain amino acid transport system substrate-binding protein
MTGSVSRRLGVLSLALLALGSTCTAINGIGFEECTADQECGASRVCIQRYCLPMPAQCRRDVGAFDKPNPIRIAALLPLSEVQGDGGTELNDARELARLNAMELAFKHVNASAGINNRLFSLYVCNTRRNSAALVEQATWAVSELGVPAVITSGSGATLTASDTPALVDAGTMLMSANATSQELSGAFRGSTWRVAPPDSLQVRVMAKSLADRPDYAGAGTIAILYEETPYGRGVASLLRERLRGEGKNSEIFGFKKDPGVTISGSEVTASLERLERFHGAAALDAGVRTKVTVLVGFPTDIVPVVTAARTSASLAYASGHRWFFSDSAKNPAIVTPLTLPQLVGAIGTTPAQGTGTAFNDFRSQYVVEFGIEPSDFSFTSHSYDAAYLVMLSAAYATRDNGALTGGRMSEGMTRLSVGTGMSFQLKSTGWRDASAALAAGRSINVDGASGQLDFDLDAGAPSSPYEVWQVTDGGSFTTVGLVNP